MTDTLQPSFASDEYVRRWLTGADPDSPGQVHDHQRSPEAHKREDLRVQKHRRHSHHGHEPPRKRPPRLRLPPRAISPQRDVGKSISVQKDQAEPEPKDRKDYPSKGHGHNHDRARSPVSPTSKAQLADEPVFQSLRPRKLDEQDPSLRYARRRRHKTRVDKYEYKGHEEEAKQSKRKTGHNRRSSRKKSGAMLAQDFKAPNIESDRLTLKQNQTPGIFSKGKASIPVPRRGIPDLTFSEMTFLNKKRDLDDARFRGIYDQVRPKTLQKAAGHEISEYFATAANASSGCRQQSMSTSRNSETESPSAKVLGYAKHSEVSAKNKSIRIRPPQHHQNIQHSHRWNVVPNVPQVYHYEPISGAPQADSHVSWSVSPEPEAPQRIDPSCTAGALKVVNQAPQRVAATVHPKSSVSNLGRSPQLEEMNYQLRTAAACQDYTLEDLKHLAATIAQDQQLDEETLPRNSGNRHQSTSDSYIAPTQSRYHTDYVADTDDPERPSFLRESACQASRTQGALEANAEASEIVKDLPIRFDHTSYEMQNSDVRVALPFSTDKKGGVIFDSVNRYSEPITPTIRFPGYPLGQDRTTTPDIELLHFHDRHYYRLEHHDDLVKPNSTSYEQYLDIAASETMNNGQREAGGLDAFDTALLRSTKNLQDRSQVVAIQSGHVPYSEVDQSSPRCYEHALGYARAEYARLASDTETTLDVSSRLDHPRRSHMCETGRPQLLRPSEDATALAPEPFTAFSRPWILY